MPAADQRFTRQGSERGEGREHLLRIAFQQPPAAERKQRVTTQQNMRIGDVKGDMAACVAITRQHCRLAAQHIHRITR